MVTKHQFDAMFLFRSENLSENKGLDFAKPWFHGTEEE